MTINFKKNAPAYTPITEISKVSGLEWLTTPTLRYWIKKHESLRQSGAILRIGKKLYIDIPALMIWISSHKI